MSPMSAAATCWRSVGWFAFNPKRPIPAPDGWTAAAPRDEIRPEFAFEPKGGPDGAGCLVIRADGREGLDGYWTKTFPIAGGKYYRFAARWEATRSPGQSSTPLGP